MAKKTSSKKAASSKGAKKGDKYVCNACGMSVKVEEPCGCGTCEVSCCGEPMECC